MVSLRCGARRPLSVEAVRGLLALPLPPHREAVGVVRDGERDAAADLLHAAPEVRLDGVPRRRLQIYLGF